MALDSSFGKAVFEIDITSEAVLRAKLQKNEQTIARSTDQMAQSFNKVAAAEVQIGDSAQIATAGITTLGAAAAATGSTSLGTAASIAVLAGAAKALGDASKGASAQVAIWGKSIAAFLISPIGLGIALAVTLAAALLAIFSPELFRKMVSFGIGVDEANDRLKEQQKLLKESNDAKKKAIELLEIQLKVAKGATAIDLEENDERRALLIAIEKAKVDRAAAVARKIAFDLLFSEEAVRNRAISAEDKRLTIARATAEAKQREADAWQSIIRSAGPQNLDQGIADIRRQVAILRAEKTGDTFIRQALKRLTSLGELSLDEVKAVRDRRFGPAGIGTQDPTRTTTGSIAVSAFASSGAGRIGGLGIDPDVQLRKRQEKDRTKDSSRIATATEQMVRNGAGGGGGAR